MLHYETIDSGTLELLKKLMSDPAFRDFFLVGGTALALQRGHRISDDIDLFTQVSFVPNYVIEFLEKMGEVRVTGEATNTLNCFVNNIKIDLLSYKYPLIDDLLIIDNIRIAGIGDIAAMKLSAVSQRGARKDFYDIYELLQNYDLEQLLKFFRVKFPAVDTFHVVRSLTWFEDAEKEKEPRLLKEYSWKQVKAFIIESVKQISR